MNTTRKLTLTAMLAALTAVTLLLSGVMSNAVLAAAASVFMCAAVIECGVGWGFAGGMTAAVIALLIIPQKTVGIAYLLFFGYYPAAKSLIERLSKPVLELVIKTALFTAAFSVGVMIVVRLGIFAAGIFKWYVYLAAAAAFIVYDFLLSGLICVYMKRISPYVNKIRKG